MAATTHKWRFEWDKSAERFDNTRGFALPICRDGLQRFTGLKRLPRKFDLCVSDEPTDDGKHVTFILAFDKRRYIGVYDSGRWLQEVYYRPFIGISHQADLDRPAWLYVWIEY